MKSNYPLLFYFLIHLDIRWLIAYHQNIMARTTIDIDDPILNEIRAIQKRREIPRSGGRIPIDKLRASSPRLEDSGISLTLSPPEADFGCASTCGLRIRRPGFWKLKNVVITTSWFYTTFSTNFWFRLELFGNNCIVNNSNFVCANRMIVPIISPLSTALT